MSRCRSANLAAQPKGVYFPVVTELAFTDFYSSACFLGALAEGLGDLGFTELLLDGTTGAPRFSCVAHDVESLAYFASAARADHSVISMGWVVPKDGTDPIPADALAIFDIPLDDDEDLEHEIGFSCGAPA